MLAETGIIGFTIWLAIVGYCFRMMLAIVERGDDIIDDVPLEVPDEVALKDWKTDKALEPAAAVADWLLHRSLLP